MINNSKSSAIIMFILWLTVVPPGIVYIYLNYPVHTVNGLHLAILTIFGILTIVFPIKRGGKSLFLVMWVTVPAFLMYGLFIEIVMMQLIILGILFTIPSELSKTFRFFLNSFLFFVLSIAAAFVFFLVGGEIGSLAFWSTIIAVICYQLTHTLLNDLIIKLYSIYLKLTSTFFSKDAILNYLIIFVVLPFALTLYFLMHFIGIGVFVLLGIPFLFVTLIVRLYNNSEKINDNLQQAGDIGHELSDTMIEKDVIDQFVMNVSKMFNAEFSYLFDYKNDWLELIRSYEHREFLDIIFNRLSPGQGIAGLVLLNNKPVIYSKREEWESVSKGYTPDAMQSILCVPITRNQKIEAVLLLSSDKVDAFEEYQLKILDILCSYFTVSVEKARYVEETVNKSERCALTKLYNYRYLEKHIEYLIDLVDNGELENFSVLMLDIDFFKVINDTYGHQSGNDILYSLARLFEDMLPENGVVGRYGGEEFVFLLPGKSKEKAVLFAEKLRLKVERFSFKITPDLGEDRRPVDVHITISIGVSSVPEDTDDAKIVLRNADRSLYIGAKQTGRNRVSSYIK